MTDTIVIADEDNAGTGYKFSWGLALAGGVTAVAVTFFLLTLGSGFGLMLVRPTAVPAFLTAGAIYFFVAQAFGFAAGGHLVGRLMGPILESHAQEEFRAAAHGVAAWAVTVLATLTMVAFAAMATLNNSAMTAAAVYGASAAKSTDATPTAYLVDRLFRPNAPGSDRARAEAGRILDAGLARGESIGAEDHDRLTTVVAREAGISREAAMARIDAMQKDIQEKTRRAADFARRTASYASLWIAFSLLFGAAVAMFAAVLARNEDDRRMLAA